MTNQGRRRVAIHFFKGHEREKGAAFIALLVSILLLGSIGIILSSLMNRMQESTPRTLQSTQAFYLAQGGVDYTGKYLPGVADWSNPGAPCPTSAPCALGIGTFSIQWGAYDPGNKIITATITGSSGNSQRKVATSFHKTGSAVAAISSQKIIAFNNTSSVNCNGEPTPCIQTNVPPANMPVVPLPSPSPPALPNGWCNFNAVGNHHIPGGTYYCPPPNGITWGNSSMNMVADGPVTIFCNKLVMSGSATFNATGNAADFLIIASSQVNINGNSTSRGAIYGPGDFSLAIGQTAPIVGIIAGGTPTANVTLSNSVQVIFDKTAGSNCPYYNQTRFGSGSQATLTDWQE